MSPAAGPSTALWMIRKRSNHLIGPLARDQVVEMVEKGHLDSEDELCPENGYWFSLHEVAEVRKQLGIKDIFVRRSIAIEGEPTLSEETLTEEQISTGSTEATGIFLRPPSVSPSGLSQAQVQQLQSQPALTGVELSEKFQRPPSAIVGMSGSDKSAESGPLERSKIWLVLLLLGLVLAAGAAVKVLHLIRA